MKLDDLKINEKMKEVFGEVEKRIKLLEQSSREVQREGFFNLANYLKEKRELLKQDGDYDAEQFDAASRYIISKLK